MPVPALYRVSPSGHDALSVDQIWTQEGDNPFAGSYRQLLPVMIGGTFNLLGFGDKGESVAWTFEPSAPYFSPVGCTIDLGGPQDLVEAFLIGNDPHLLVYTAHGEGAFNIIPITASLGSLEPYRLTRSHPPGATGGYTVTKPIEVGAAVYLLCYGFDTGHVAIYSVNVTATSTNGTPPLVVTPTWDHQWARSWTRFAFFRLGSGAYFLKTNVGKLNVNIDHVLDNPGEGTVEVGTNLDLEDALTLDLVVPFYVGSDPYFATYKKDGTTTLNRFHGNCQGWSTNAKLSATVGATHIVPLETAGQTLLLVV